MKRSGGPTGDRAGPPERGRSILCLMTIDTSWVSQRNAVFLADPAARLAATAVARLSREAERRGVASRVTGRVHDVEAGLPEGPFDLVTSFYVHGGPEEGSLDLVALLSDAAARVAPGGRLLTAVHAVNPPWHRHHARTYTAGELVSGLAEATAGWEVVVAEERRRWVIGPDGQEDSRADAVVCLRRPPASV